MFKTRKGISFLIIMYIIFCILIWYYKPNIMFKDGKVKEFGVGKNKSIFCYNIVILFLAIIMFYVFEIYWLKKNNFISLY